MKLLVSALEPSANLHLEPLLNALETYEVYGIFDERFGKPLMPSRAFSIMGFLDALPKIRKAKRAIKIMTRMSFFVDKVILIKLYFSVSKEEQKRRFDRRINDPLRQWKFSEVDMQAQDLWDEFSEKKYEMLRRTTSRSAPWHIIRSD